MTDISKLPPKTREACQKQAKRLREKHFTAEYIHRTLAERWGVSVAEVQKRVGWRDRAKKLQPLPMLEPCDKCGLQRLLANRQGRRLCVPCAKELLPRPEHEYTEAQMEILKAEALAKSAKKRKVRSTALNPVPRPYEIPVVYHMGVLDGRSF